MSAIIIVGSIAVILGLSLAVAAKFFAVDTDSRIEEITDILPGVNCGGCGYSGCSQYATVIVNDNAKTNLCPVGKNKVANEIAEKLGRKAEEIEEKTAFVKCSGTCNTTEMKYNYDGVMDCFTASKLAGGPKVCNSACIGLGTCKKECKFGAIEVVNGLAMINPKICTACGKCVDACPKGIIELHKKAKNRPYIACSSPLFGKNVSGVCTKGCIGCGICAKVCPKEAIELQDCLPAISVDKCINCGLCIEKCPRKVIL